MNKSDYYLLKLHRDMSIVLYDASMHKTAQSNLSDITSKLGDHFKSLYDENNPVESILSFMAPGMLWLFGFKWIAVLFELAQAFGFDWVHFFSSIKEKIKPFLTSLVETKKGDANHIHDIVASAAQESVSETLDPDKLIDAVKKSEGSLADMLLIKKMAQRSDLKDQIERLLAKGTSNRMRKGILGFIIRLVSWIITAILISLGFALAGGLVSTIIGGGAAKKEEHSSDEPTQETKSDNAINISAPADSKTQTSVKLVLNNSAPQELFTESFNDTNHVWIMHININQIKDHLIKWAQQLYPQLTNLNAFNNSSSFNRTLEMFKNRNKNNNVDLLAVPSPFTSIKDIVDSFALDVAEHMN